MVRAMSTGLFLEFLGIRMDSTKAESFEFKINLSTPDNGEKYVVELSAHSKIDPANEVQSAHTNGKRRRVESP